MKSPQILSLATDVGRTVVPPLATGSKWREGEDTLSRLGKKDEASWFSQGLRLTIYIYKYNIIIP